MSPELRGYNSTQQVQVIVQYAPGTQVNCSGLLGLVDCLVNDVVKLGGTILGRLPLVNGVVALLDGNGILNLSNQSNVVYISSDRPLTPTLSNAAARGECRVCLAVELYRSRHRRGADRQRREQHPDLNMGMLPFLARRRTSSLSCREIPAPMTSTVTARTSPG